MVLKPNPQSESSNTKANQFPVANIEKNLFTTTPQIDWLTLRIDYVGGKLNLDKRFAFQVMPYNTRTFKRVIEITDINLQEVVATIVDVPLSKAIRPDLILIKFHNKLLYTDHLKQYILDFCKSNNFKINAISRFDIAVDFVEFCNGLHPEVFIKRFLNGQYVKKGYSKFKAAGKYQDTLDNAFIVQGHAGRSIRHEYLRFGTKNNGLQYYVYNKTKELKDVKHKPYIVERWEKFGYISQPKAEIEGLGTFDEDAPDVWRLEFSITSNDLRFIQNDTGEPVTKNKNEIVQEKLLINKIDGELIKSNVQEINLKSLECLDEDILKKIWASLVNKYMVFYKGNNARKDRNHKLNLFAGLPNYVAYTCDQSLKDTTNTEKNFITNLRRTYEDLRTKDYNISESIKQVIQYNVEYRGLEKWARERDILNFNFDSLFKYKASDGVILQVKKDSQADKTKRFNKDDGNISDKPPD